MAFALLAVSLTWADPGWAQRDSSSEIAERIEALATPHAEAELLSGVILVARGDEIVFNRAYGLADWELRTPNTLEMRFGVGSITKAMTAIVTHMLHRTGRLDLDDPVAEYVPGFPTGPAGGVPTIRHLLTHRAGVPHRVTTPIEETQALHASDIVARVTRSGLLFEPGTERLYSSAGYTCLARVIEIAESAPFSAVLAERVFKPAGMTSATDETGQVLMPQRAASYRLGSSGGRIVVKKTPNKDLRFLTGAGSVYSTAKDLLHMVQALEHGVFDGAAWEGLFDADEGEWQGWLGRTNGYEASFDVLPSSDLVFVFLSNIQSATNWQLRNQIRNILVSQTPTAIPLPPDVAAPFEDPAGLVGTYGRAEIRLIDGSLFRGENEFYPIEGERYYIPGSGTTMRFRRDPAGTVDALISIRSGGQESVLPKTAP